MLLLFALFAGLLTSAFSQGIPLTRCCSPEEFYSIGYDECQSIPSSGGEEAPNDEPSVNHHQHFPPIFSLRDNQPIRVTPEQFDLTQNLSICPDGYIGKSASSFRFFEDGSLMLLTGRRRFNPGDFCISQTGDDHHDDSPVFVARFCISDPCIGRSCIKKCCPEGMSINYTTRLCQTSSIQLNVDLHDENGTLVELESPMFIRDGVVPKCPEGLLPHTPEENKDEIFHILHSDGRMFVPSWPEGERHIEDYCIDYLMYDDNHSTLFGLSCIAPAPELSWTTYAMPYFLFFSSIFLIATFIVYAIVPEIRNIHGISIMSHVASLAIMYIGLGTIQLTSHMPQGVCIGMAVVTHWAFLSTFTWLNVMSFDIWWTFSDLRPTLSSRGGRPHTGRRLIFYSIYAWTVPTIIVVIGVILDNADEQNVQNIIRPEFGVTKCWFNEDGALVAYLYGPMAFLILSNMLFFAMTLFLLYRASIDSAFANSGNNQTKQKLRVILSLSVLMGVSWMTELISFAVGGKASHWFFTDALNILTGIFIFFIFVYKPNVWKLLKHRFPCMERLDVCCPSWMKTASIAHGRSTRQESNSTTVSGKYSQYTHPEAHKMISVASTGKSVHHLRDSGDNA